MTYNEIKQRVYDILCMPMEEAARLHYTDKIPRLINEALFRIAHSVLPNLREYTVILTDTVLPAKLTMPPDFISFADEQNAYLNGRQFLLTEFIGSDGVILTGKETQYTYRRFKIAKFNEYHIFYNALYPKLVESGIYYNNIVFAEGKDIPINSDNYTTVKVNTEASRVNSEGEIGIIPDIAGMLVPHYVAGQLLVLDDKVRSIEEMNEFENLLATINTNRNERPREYHSAKGLY